MKKYFEVYLLLICIYVNAKNFKQFFKKLGNKKISSDFGYYKNATFSNA